VDHAGHQAQRAPAGQPDQRRPGLGHGHRERGRAEPSSGARRRSS
jgi:hypothetical protein